MKYFVTTFLKNGILSVLLCACFVKCSEAPPIVPEIIAPEVPPMITQPIEGDERGNCVTVKWDAVAGAESYTVQLATDAIFSLNGSILEILQVMAPETEVLFEFTETDTYFVRIKAENIAGESAWSVGVSFHASAASFFPCFPVPNAPTLSLPADGAVVSGNAQTLSWLPVNNATRYHLQVSATTNFEPPLIYDNDMLGIVERPLEGFLFSRTYSWRVRAFDHSSFSLWSEVRTFVVIE